MNLVTLINGREVDSASEEWRQECLDRHRHVENMRWLNLHQRRDYLANVERKEGAEAERRLREAFTVDWEARRAPSRDGGGSNG